eukprot:Clim_evm15s144 gene=Clim_evmTU15s144
MVRRAVEAWNPFNRHIPKADEPRPMHRADIACSMLYPLFFCALAVAWAVIVVSDPFFKWNATAIYGIPHQDMVGTEYYDKLIAELLVEVTDPAGATTFDATAFWSFDDDFCTSNVGRYGAQSAQGSTDLRDADSAGTDSNKTDTYLCTPGYYEDDTSDRAGEFRSDRAFSWIDLGAETGEVVVNVRYVRNPNESEREYGDVGYLRIPSGESATVVFQLYNLWNPSEPEDLETTIFALSMTLHGTGIGCASTADGGDPTQLEFASVGDTDRCVRFIASPLSIEIAQGMDYLSSSLHLLV